MTSRSQIHLCALYCFMMALASLALAIISIRDLIITAESGVRIDSLELLKALTTTAGVPVLIAAGIGLCRLRPWGYAVAFLALLAGTIVFQSPGVWAAYAGFFLGSMSHWGFGHGRKLEQAIDRLAQSVGIDFDDATMQQFEQWLHQKRRTDAARLIHETLHISWDDAHALVAEWPVDAAYRKVLFMVSRLKHDATPA
jgi:hypothetical protein